MRTYSEDALEALESGEVIVSGAVLMELDTPRRFWGGHGDIEIDGETFTGLGDHGLARETGGTLGGSEQGLDLELSGIDPDVLAMVDASELRGAPVVIWELIFDGSGSNLLAAQVDRRGRVDTAVREDVIGGPSVLILSIEGAARGLGRNTVRIRSDADQRTFMEDDPAFSNVAWAHEKQLYLGGEKPTSIGGGRSGGCPAPETLITLSDGRQVEAGGIKVGEWIWTRHEITGAWGAYEVEAAERIDNAFRWRVAFSDGRTLIASPSHPLAVRAGEGLVWTRLDEIKSGAVVMGEPDAVVSTVEPWDQGPVMRITVREAHAYLTNGLQSHNKRSTEKPGESL